MKQAQLESALQQISILEATPEVIDFLRALVAALNDENIAMPDIRKYAEGNIFATWSGIGPRDNAVLGFHGKLPAELFTMEDRIVGTVNEDSDNPYAGIVTSRNSFTDVASIVTSLREWIERQVTLVIV